MKLLSSSVIVLAGAIILSGAAQAERGETGFVLMSTGFLVSLMGLGGWCGSLVGKKMPASVSTKE